MANPPLGNHYDIRHPPPVVHDPAGGTGEILEPYDKSLKWRLQEVARTALPRHRLQICHRYVRPDKKEVQVRRKDDGNAYFANLMTCGAVHVCPICVAKIQAVRTAEVRQALDNWDGDALMVTYTVPHTRQMRLKPLLDSFLEAHRRLTKGASWKRLREQYGLHGSIKALEVTWGQSNGWHPHLHVIYVVQKGHEVGFDSLQSTIYKHWVRACEAVGITGLSERCAVDVGDATEVKSYLTKSGTEYQWNAEHELVKSATKRGRGKRYTPFDMLRSYLEQPDDGQMLKLFAEYAEAFKGRRQLRWSPGLKKELLNTEGQTDEQIADSLGENDPVLAYINLDDWKLIRKENAQANVLRVVELHGKRGLKLYLDSLRI